MTKPPLLIIDVQAGFVNENSRHVVPVIRALADEWLDDRAPIYMSQFTNKPGSQWERLLGWKRLQGEDEIRFCSELELVSKRAVTYRKESYSCMVGRFLRDLRKHRWTDVVLCGIATDGCVLATAVDLFEYAGWNIRPIVVRDACASHAGENVNDAGLLLIERFIGREQVIPSAALLNGHNGLGSS